MTTQRFACVAIGDHPESTAKRLHSHLPSHTNDSCRTIRKKALELRALASAEHDPHSIAEWLGLAQRYTRLADKAAMANSIIESVADERIECQENNVAMTPSPATTKK